MPGSSSLLLFLLASALLALLPAPASALQCWQCASVDNRRCPDDSKMVDSVTHDACITWRLGNGTVILQNVVMFENECTTTKIDFWTRFIDLYYQSEGGEVRCCDEDGCNTGSFSDDFFLSDAPSGQQAIPGAPLIFGAVSNAPPAFAPPTTQAPARLNQLPVQLAQQQQQQQLLMAQAQAAAAQAQAQQLNAGSLLGYNFGLNQNAFQNQNGFQNQNAFQNPAGTPQLITTRQTGGQQSAFLPQQTPTNNLQLALNQLQGQAQAQASAADFGLSGFPQQQLSGLNGGLNGNCGKYFTVNGDGEWLPTTLMPLSFDRASQTKVGVFYTKFNGNNGNNDHVIVRLVNKQRSNTTMYSFKLYRVGTVSLFVSRLEPNNNARVGGFTRSENRVQAVQNGVNLTDTAKHMGFWFTVKEDELALGTIGDQLIDPVIIWNDTLRQGPRDVQYFALTTDQSTASFGVNCDVPNLHFADTCVTDEDCEAFPNTVCASEPVNKGLDPGTRETPFREWEDRDTLLKSCFCREGHMRIPMSNGCYDPIRKVVTLRDACFADYHCNDLPNTHCVFDKDVARYNKSCQCIPGNKAFDTDPRTGLIEGCAPLTEADKASVEGCATRLSVEDEFAWVPDDLYPLTRNEGLGVDTGVVFIKLGPQQTNTRNNNNEAAIIRLLDDRKSERKFYTVKFYRHDGRITISESERTRSFFFENERDAERVSINELDVMTRMQLDYVGFWIQYRHEEGLGGTLSVGLNGSPFSPDYSLVRWTDTSATAIRNLQYIGFTATPGATVNYGTSCVLLDTPIGVSGNTFAPQLSITQQALQQQAAAAAGGSVNQFAGAGTQQQQQQFNVFGNNNLNRVNPNLVAQQQQQLLQQTQQNLQLQQQLQSLQQNLGFPTTAGFGSASGRVNTASAPIVQPQGQVQNQAAPASLGLSQLSPWDFSTSRSSSQKGFDSPAGGDALPQQAAFPSQLVPNTPRPENIIEPVLRNPYLTKLQRLLPPTFFNDLTPKALEKIAENPLPSVLLEETDKASGKTIVGSGEEAPPASDEASDEASDGGSFNEDDYRPTSSHVVGGGALED